MTFCEDTGLLLQFFKQNIDLSMYLFICVSIYHSLFGSFWSSSSCSGGGAISRRRLQRRDGIGRFGRGRRRRHVVRWGTLGKHKESETSPLSHTAHSPSSRVEMVTCRASGGLTLVGDLKQPERFVSEFCKSNRKSSNGDKCALKNLMRLM